MTDEREILFDDDVALPSLARTVGTYRAFTDEQLIERDAAIEARVRAEIEPCDLEHLCAEDDDVCGCRCGFHDVPLEDCSTYRTVRSWLAEAEARVRAEVADTVRWIDEQYEQAQAAARSAAHDNAAVRHSEGLRAARERGMFHASAVARMAALGEVRARLAAGSSPDTTPEPLKVNLITHWLPFSLEAENHPFTDEQRQALAGHEDHQTAGAWSAFGWRELRCVSCDVTVWSITTPEAKP